MTSHADFLTFTANASISISQSVSYKYVRAIWLSLMGRQTSFVLHLNLQNVRTEHNVDSEKMLLAGCFGKVSIK